MSPVPFYMATGNITKYMSGVDSGWVELTNPDVFAGSIYYRQIGPIVHVILYQIKLNEPLTGIQKAILPNGSLPKPYKVPTIMGGSNDYYRFAMCQVTLNGGLMLYRYSSIPGVTEYAANSNIFFSATYLTE